MFTWALYDYSSVNRLILKQTGDLAELVWKLKLLDWYLDFHVIMTFKQLQISDENVFRKQWCYVANGSFYTENNEARNVLCPNVLVYPADEGNYQFHHFYTFSSTDGYHFQAQLLMWLIVFACKWNHHFKSKQNSACK